MKWNNCESPLVDDSRISTCTLLLFLVFLMPLVGFSGEFRVSPIRMEFDVRAKSGAITVFNEGSEQLNLQMKATEWIQDSEGNDQYPETNDIIFFPKIMTLGKGESRVIRAGIRTPAVASEKTYRLFIEEIPEPKKVEGAQVAIAVRLGAPIFVKPIKEEAKGEVGKIDLSEGNLNIVVRNTGNVHFSINTIKIRGKNWDSEEVFSREVNGWYLLSGVSRTYTTQVPQEICIGLRQIEIEIKTDRFTLNDKFDVSKAMCVSSY